MNSLVKQDNRLRWETGQKPFYEVYYVKLVSPHEDWSFWCRYTLLSPSNRMQPGYAALWGVFVSRDSENSSIIAIRRKFMLSQIDLFHSERFFDLGESYLSLDGACGQLSDSDHKLTWDFKFEDPTASAAMYHHPFLYRWSFPSTKFIEPRASTLAAGYLTVDHHAYKLEGVRAHQAHIWGARYSPSWFWTHCNQFKEDANAHFEGLSAVTKIASWTLPPITLFYFYFEGEWFEANTLKHWFSNKAEGNLLRWSFRAICRGHLFEGEITRSEFDIAGVEYEGPLGEKRYCHNTMLATLKISVSKRQNGQWKLYKELTSNTAAFETVESMPEAGVNYVL